MRSLSEFARLAGELHAGRYAARPGQELPEELLLDSEGDLAVYYAPFDFLNRHARVVIVGITPGAQQALRSLHTFRDALRQGESVEEAAQAAKKTAAFCGAMRSNLVAMLDHVGLNCFLGIQGCHELWGASSQLVHTTSLLRYPVLRRGQNYNGSPKVLGTPLLERYVRRFFVGELRELPDAVVIPLGSKVETVVLQLAEEGVLDRERVLSGLPHPSGANAERVSYFLGRKEARRLSSKTNPHRLDASREQLCATISALAKRSQGGL